MEDWITASPTQEEGGNGIVDVTVDSNSTSVREGTITISGGHH